MDSKKSELKKILMKYRGPPLNFSDPFMWAEAIDYILRNWKGKNPLTHEDVRLAIANHIIERMISHRSQPYPQNPPLFPANPSLIAQITANRTIHILNQHLQHLQPRPLPFQDAGILYPDKPTFGRVLAQRANLLSLDAPPPVFFPGQECLVCIEEITGPQAQNPGIAFCTTKKCSARTHLSCFDSMTTVERSAFFSHSTCPTKCSTMPEWRAYKFSPFEIAAAAVAPPPNDAAEIINAQDIAYAEGVRIDFRRFHIEEILGRPDFVAQTPEQLARALTTYRSENQGDNDITQEEFNAVVERLLKKNKGGKKIRHNKHSKSNKRSNKKRRSSYGKKNKTGKKRLYKRRQTKRIQTKKQNCGNNGGGRLPVFEKLERGISIPNPEEDQDTNFWLRRGMIDAKSRKIMDNRLDTIDAESRRRQDAQAMSGYDTDDDSN
jgi:hypothetical protein